MAKVLRSILILTALLFGGITLAEEGDHNLLVRPVGNSGMLFANHMVVDIPKGHVAKIVSETAKRYGVPEQVAHYHVKRESGYNPRAKNPRSTATGTLQVVTKSREIITGEPVRTLSEHMRIMSDPYKGTAIGMAHIAACHRRHPEWTAHQLWVRGHVGGLRNCGSSLQEAAQLYQQHG